MAKKSAATKARKATSTAKRKASVRSGTVGSSESAALDELQQRTGRVIRKTLTPTERKKLKQAWAEEEVGMDANKAVGRTVLAERKRLADAVKLLKSLREDQGVSLSVLSERTGMTRGNLSRLENMEGPNPTIGTLDRYARALGQTIEITVVEAVGRK